MEPVTIATIISAILAVVGILFGKKYKKFKDLFNMVVAIVVEAKKALEDDNVTKEEVKKILDKINDLTNDNK